MLSEAFHDRAEVGRAQSLPPRGEAGEGRTG